MYTFKYGFWVSYIYVVAVVVVVVFVNHINLTCTFIATNLLLIPEVHLE